MYSLRKNEEGTDPEELKKNALSLNWINEDADEDADEPVTDDARKFAVYLIEGTISREEEIDALIMKHSKNWKIERIGLVDKCILRLSLFSLLYIPETEIPSAVTINEGIELGKLYGGETSRQFINGILDAVKKSQQK